MYPHYKIWGFIFLQKSDINVISQNKNPYKIRAKLSYWWRIRDSNPWPPACKAGALANWANSPKQFTYKVYH